MKETIFSGWGVLAESANTRGDTVYSVLNLPKATMNVLNEACQNHEYNKHVVFAMEEAYRSGVQAGDDFGRRQGTAKGILVGSAITFAICAISGVMIYLDKKKSKKKRIQVKSKGVMKT